MVRFLINMLPKAALPWVVTLSIGFVAGSYFLGRSHGYDSGALDGERQAHRLLEAERERVEGLQIAVQELGAQASRAWLAWYESEQSKAEPRVEVVTQWRERLVPQECGVSKDTADMINDLMDLDLPL